jgi:hypothetical protein
LTSSEPQFMLFTAARWDIDMKSDPRASAAEKQILIGQGDTGWASVQLALRMQETDSRNLHILK